MGLDLNTHPCYSVDAKGKFGRIHLPVAPACNVQCKFCNRKYDCPNESRPGVSSAVLTPSQALEYTEKALERVTTLSVVGIAGPGDPFANIPETMQTLELVRQRFPDVLLCLASNGLELTEQLDDLARLKVSHVTVTVNAVDPVIGAEIYSWIRYGKRIYRGVEGAQILLDRQLEAIRGLKQRDIMVKINSIAIPYVNLDHIPAIAKEMSALKVDLFNCIPMFPAPGAEFEDIPEPSGVEIARIREESEIYVPQMRHCARCRADAVGFLGQAPPVELRGLLNSVAHPEPAKARDKVAVASWEGVLVNQHLGEAKELSIWSQQDGKFTQVGTRKAPEPGSGKDRWAELAEVLSDCRSLMVSGIGPSPRTVLEATGLQILEMEGLIEEGLKSAFAGDAIHPALARKFVSCRSGDGCGGSGTGCS